MSHHGMHIPPNMLPMLPGMNPYEKTDKAKKKQRLRKSASTGEMEAVDETKEEEEIFGAARPAPRSSNQQTGARTGGKPRQQQLSDKVIKSLLAAQEGIEDT